MIFLNNHHYILSFVLVLSNFLWNLFRFLHFPLIHSNRSPEVDWHIRLAITYFYYPNIMEHSWECSKKTFKYYRSTSFSSTASNFPIYTMLWSENFTSSVHKVLFNVWIALMRCPLPYLQIHPPQFQIETFSLVEDVEAPYNVSPMGLLGRVANYNGLNL